MIKFPLLTSEDIEVKVKQITKSGALLLLYKTSRTDAKILDRVLGPMNWTDEYLEVKGNLYCRVGVRENLDQQFVYKMDCGVESGQDDGQEKKAEASDAFKRCCSKLGIGRELYTSPQIWANVATVEKGSKWALEDPYAKYIVTNIEYNEETRVITSLEICNAKSGIKVFGWTMPTTGAMAKKMVKTIGEAETVGTKVEAKVEDKPKTSKSSNKADTATFSDDKGKSSSKDKTPLKMLVTEIGKMVKAMYTKEGSPAKYNEIVAEITHGAEFKCNTATEEQYDAVLAIHDRLIADGYSA